jgi:hypothetical protein
VLPNPGRQLAQVSPALPVCPACLPCPALPCSDEIDLVFQDMDLVPLLVQVRLPACGSKGGLLGAACHCLPLPATACLPSNCPSKLRPRRKTA